jgi:hypothetical protein
MSSCRSATAQAVGDLLRSGCAVLVFPFGDTLAAGIDPQTVRCGLGDPRADGGAFRDGGLVDGVARSAGSEIDRF